MSPPKHRIEKADIFPDHSDKVGIKGILKDGSHTQRLHRHGMDQFQLETFEVSGRSSPKASEAAIAEMRQLQEQLGRAEKEIADLRRQLDARVKTAYEKGLAEGLHKGEDKGRKSAQEQFESKLAVLQQESSTTLEALRGALDIYYVDLQNTAFELALGLAKRMYCTEAERNPDLISQVVAEALRYLGQEETLVVKVHPLDAPQAEATRDFWMPISSQVKGFQVVADARVEQGGCWIESADGGTIDLRRQTLLGQLEKAVRSAYGRLGG